MLWNAAIIACFTDRMYSVEETVGFEAVAWAGSFHVAKRKQERDVGRATVRPWRFVAGGSSFLDATITRAPQVLIKRHDKRCQVIFNSILLNSVTSFTTYAAAKYLRSSKVRSN